MNDMSAGICGKRLGFGEILENDTTPSKRSRCYQMDSPIGASDSILGSADDGSALLETFPAVDRLLVGSVLNARDHSMEDAADTCHISCFPDDSGRKSTFSRVKTCSVSLQGSDIMPSPEWKSDDFHGCSNLESSISQNGSSWVDIFVQEMMNASDLDDARIRTLKTLEAFGSSILARSQESDTQMALLKEQLHSLLKENQILKKAIVFQHERCIEQEERMEEVLQLKHLAGQYQEQIRTLEMNNYSLKLHLRRAQHCSSSIPHHFHPDVF